MKEYLNQESSSPIKVLRGLFKNNFELANQAIRLARFYIKSGHEVSMRKLLNEIKRNPSEQYLKDLLKMEDEEDEDSQRRKASLRCIEKS